MAFLFFDISKSSHDRDTDFETLEKFNPYHGSDGRFTTGAAASSFTYKPGTNTGANAITREMFRTGKNEIKVMGPAASGKFIEDYEKDHPGTKEKAKEFGSVMSNVRDFQKNHPGAEMGTYNAVTGELDNPDGGICVTFHQNHTTKDPYGDYSDQTYAEMCAISMRELGSKNVQIGYFGNAEVSFNTNDKKRAVQFCIEHNQHSLYDCDTGATIRNPYYNSDLNPIEF